MIQVGETSDVAAEVLFFLADINNPLVGLIGHVFVLGEVTIKPPGAGSFTNVALDHIIERGLGWYAIRVTSAQRATAGELAYDATVSGAQPDRGTEIIGTSGGDIAEGASGVLPFYLPNEVDPVYSPPVTGHVFVLGEVKHSLPGGAFGNTPLTSIVEFGNGIYGVVLAPGDTGARGKALVYADVPTAQVASGYRSIVSASTIAPAIFPYISTPPSGPFVFPFGPGLAEVCDPEFFDEAALLAVIDRVFPEWYLSPLKDPGPGYEMFQAYANVFERVSLAVGRFECSSYITHSHGGQRAAGTVEFYRSSLVSGLFTVKQGTIVKTSKTNRAYRTTMDVSFGATDLTVLAPVESVGYGPEYNVPGPILTADGTLLLGEIDIITIPILDPHFAEPTLQVRQVLDVTGGLHPVLDQHGLDRNLPRFPGESDETYKGRIRALSDTVAIDAIRRQLDILFLTNDLNYKLIETWENQYNSCWNQPGPGTHPIFGVLPELAYNDPRTDRFIPRWMSERDHRSAFVVIVPSFPAFADRGMAYNDPATVSTSTRGTSAYNAPVADTPAYFSGVWNGEDDDSSESRAAFLHKTWDVLRQIKGAGVFIAFFPAEASQSLA